MKGIVYVYVFMAIELKATPVGLLTVIVASAELPVTVDVPSHENVLVADT